MIEGLLITTDAEVRRIPVDGLKDVQAAVGGYIEPVASPRSDTIAYANEEGLLMGLPYNACASNWLGQDIVGNVLVLGHDGSSSETDCPEGVEAEL